MMKNESEMYKMKTPYHINTPNIYYSKDSLVPFTHSYEAMIDQLKAFTEYKDHKIFIANNIRITDLDIDEAISFIESSNAKCTTNNSYIYANVFESAFYRELFISKDFTLLYEYIYCNGYIIKMNYQDSTIKIVDRYDTIIDFNDIKNISNIYIEDNCIYAYKDYFSRDIFSIVNKIETNKDEVRIICYNPQVSGIIPRGYLNMNDNDLCKHAKTRFIYYSPIKKKIIREVVVLAGYRVSYEYDIDYIKEGE